MGVGRGCRGVSLRCYGRRVPGATPNRWVRKGWNRCYGGITKRLQVTWWGPVCRGREPASRPSKLPIMKSILSVVPAPKENPQRGKELGRALPIEFVEVSRTESYGE